jgi:hypothetical protein
VTTRNKRLIHHAILRNICFQIPVPREADATQNRASDVGVRSTSLAAAYGEETGDIITNQSGNPRGEAIE